MAGMTSRMLCDHANEAPMVCPCAADCLCRSSMCEPKRDGPMIGWAYVEASVRVDARLLGADRATLDLELEAAARHVDHQVQVEAHTVAVMEADGTVVYADERLEARARSYAGWDKFVDEVRRLLPAASVLGA